MDVIDHRKYINVIFIFKIHNKTGLRYLVYTSKNPFKYKGSGLHWKRHLNIHGNDVTTEVLRECIDKNEVKYWGEYFSALWDVVDNKSWANLKPELGDGGSAKGVHVGFRHSTETKKIISIKKKGISAPWSSYPRTEEQKLNLSIKLSGRKRSVESLEKSRITKELNPFRHSTETKEKLKIPKSEKTKQKMGESQRKRRENNLKDMWITNGVDSLMVKQGSIMPHGWMPGRTTTQVPPSQKGKFWITNGIENKMVTEILPGFVKGRS